MKDVCIFVGGPIQYAIAPGGVFHSSTRCVIEKIIACLRDQDYRVLSAHEYENFGEMDVSEKFQEVCYRDFKWMRKCDVFVAILPLDADGKVVFSAGTSVELGWASAMDKPIVLICDPAPIYSHLVIGLDAVARVAKIDINRLDLSLKLCKVIAKLISQKEQNGSNPSLQQEGNLVRSNLFQY